MVEDLRIGEPAPVPPDPGSEREISSNWKTDHEKPLVSIICHTYNHVEYIADALNGFLMQQTEFPYEIIVHDDASTDGTADIVRSYAEQFPGIIRPIFQTSNQFRHGSKPPQFSFPVSQGKYIALCEGDDYWLDPSKLQIQVRFMEENPEFALCGHDACIVENGLLVARSKLPSDKRRDFSSKSLQKGNVFVLTLSAMFVNKLNSIPFEHSRVVNGDTFLFSRLGEFGGAKYLDSICSAVYRRHENSLWSSVERREQVASLVNTNYWMMQYYQRMENPRLANHFAFKAALDLIGELPGMTMKEWLSFNIRVVKWMIKKRYRGER